MLDTFNREVDYLRISVTDLCNLRCIYCMGKEGVQKLSHDQIISPERIGEIVEETAKLGIKKVRITGGEPLVRKGIIDICNIISSVNGIEEVCLTTNGILLKSMAKDLKAAGVKRLNISLDTLNEEKYHHITRVGHLKDVLEGIKEAKKVGFNIKVNVVLIGGFNDDEIPAFVEFAKENSLIVRFIELMPIGVSKEMPKDSFILNTIVLDKIPNLHFIRNDGVSSLYRIGNSDGYIGLISPLSHRFCEKCSRLRLTADGKLKPCLHSSLEIPTEGKYKEELRETIKKAILSKPKEHHLDEGKGSEALRNMNEIGG